MAVCICDITAQWFWRRYQVRLGSHVFGHTPGSGPMLPEAFPSRNLPVEKGCRNFDNGVDAAGIQKLRAMGRSSDDPVHVLLARSNRTNSSKSAIVHTINGDPPFGSFLRCDQGFCVTSPEMTLLRACSSLTLVERLKLAYEYCGCYAHRPELEGGLLIRHPLTSVEELESYLDVALGMTGAKQLRQALPYVRDGSGSPRETALVLLCCLPKRYGGFGLPFPELNLNVELGSGSSRLWGGGNAFDLVWKSAKVIVEYDGELGHLTSDQRSRDQRRREAAQAAGYAVFALDKKRLESAADTYAVVEKVAERVGCRLRLGPTFRERHCELRRQVL